MNKKYMTVKEAAEVLGITERGVRYRCEQGHIETVRFGKTWAIKRAEFMEWAEEWKDFIGR